MIYPFQPNFDWREIVALPRLGTGRQEFESVLAAQVGARYGVAFAYGRSGMIAAFKALGLTDAEVVMPAYTCSVVAAAVIASENRPVFVDIDLADYNMEAPKIKDVLTRQTRAIIATHMYGYRTDISAIRDIVRDDRILIIEDAALLGPCRTDSGAKIQRGDIAVFSFGPGKHLYTARGGVVVTDSVDLYEKIKRYRDREMNSLSWKAWAKRLARLINGYVMLSPTLFEMLEKIQQTGTMQRVRSRLKLAKVDLPDDYAMAFADLQARVGLAQLRKFDYILSEHRARADFYTRELGDVPGLVPAPIVEGASYSSYTVRVKDRDAIRFCQRMRAAGIETGRTFDYALPLLRLCRPFAQGEYPHAAQAARQVVNLPIYPGLSTRGAQYVAESVRRALEGPE